MFCDIIAFWVEIQPPLPFGAFANLAIAHHFIEDGQLGSGNS
jgi:hypothetical protein